MLRIASHALGASTQWDQSTEQPLAIPPTQALPA
jgi:hypothetical protein